VTRTGGRTGCFDFLKLPALRLDLAKEYRAQGLQGIDALFGLRDASRDGNISLHVGVVFREIASI
jgi:hypothetical protein